MNDPHAELRRRLAATIDDRVTSLYETTTFSIADAVLAVMQANRDLVALWLAGTDQIPDLETP